MRATLAAVAFCVLACSNSSDKPVTPPPDDAAPAVIRNVDANVRATTATRAEIDCATLLTVDDIQRVCGAAIRHLKATAVEKPGRNCNRAGGPYNARFLFMLAIGSGDVGHKSSPPKLFKQTVGSDSWQTVVLNKKPFELQLRTQGKKPLCDAAQLQKLAAEVINRLP